jgi:hypothetical protein
VPKAHYNQLTNSLKAINLKLGILVNFGAPSLIYKRLINPSKNLREFVRVSEAPKEEQSICVTCGFCCDGTLFLNACLNPGEQGKLPEKIEESSFSEGDKEYFRLPCKYFSEKCTIYDQKRAYVCSGYRCQLLKDFAEGKVALDDALEAIRGAWLMRSEVMIQFRLISSSEGTNFRQLLLEMGKIMKSASADKPLNMDIEMLIAKCNIFEALLIKYFRSSEDFEKMMIVKEDKRQK